MPHRLLVPSKGERISRSLAYLSVVGAGIFVIAGGQLPLSVENNVAGWHLIVFTIFSLSAVIAAWSSWRGRFLYEFGTLPFVAGSVLVYAVCIAYVAFVSNESPGSALALFYMGALLFSLSARFISLLRLVDTPWSVLRRKKEVSV